MQYEVFLKLQYFLHIWIGFNVTNNGFKIREIQNN
jgi:hypothetical protein